LDRSGFIDPMELLGCVGVWERVRPCRDDASEDSRRMVEADEWLLGREEWLSWRDECPRRETALERWRSHDPSWGEKGSLRLGMSHAATNLANGFLLGGLAVCARRSEEWDSRGAEA
jgi:hypothetical protein